MKKFLSLAMSLLLCLNYSFIPIQAEEGDAAHSQGETPQEISGENNEEVSEESNPVIEKDDNSSDEGEEQKSIVDYIQGRDIIGDLEDEHAIEEDDRVKELRQKRNNLKEIIEKKNVNETAMQTNPV